MPCLRHAPLCCLTLAAALWAGPFAAAQPSQLALRAGIDVAAAPDGRPLDPVEALALRRLLGLNGDRIPIDPRTGLPAIELFDDPALEAPVADGTPDDTIGRDPDAVGEPPRAAVGPAVEPAGELYDPPVPALDGVTTRPRPELEPLGLRVGSFTVFSDTEGAVEFTDNVLAAGDDRRADTYYVVRPTLRARSDWAAHALEFAYAGEHGVHAETESENRTAASFAANGRIDVSHATQVGLRAGWAADQEGAGDVDVPDGAAEPTRFRTLELGGELTHRINRLSGSLRGALTVQDYDDSTDGLGLPANNDDRDRAETGAGLRLAYQLTPATAVFADAYYARVRHAAARDDLGFARDADRRTVLAGVTLRPSRLVEFEASLGHVREDFADPRLAAVDEVTGGARLAWSVTPLTTLTAEVATEVGATTLAGASAQVSRTARAGFDHELLRNLIVSGQASVNRTEYRGIDLAEETVAAGIGAEYWLSRWVAVLARYAHSTETSTAAGAAAVVENLATVGLRVRN